ncbi:hypothetical protein NHQ30_009955 [Ciborinia camelliae]|nr:hypothetical protein NHQ30_009955 [Ciborinia camelliae]
MDSMDECFEIIDLPDGYHISELSGDQRAIQPLVAAMQLTVTENLTKRGGPIFHADLSLSDPAGKDFGMNIIYEMFSRGLPNQRRMMSCEICETFIRDFGDLCYLSDDATLVPLLWPGEDVVPDYYRQAVANVRKMFEGRPLGKDFLSHLETLSHRSAYYARKSDNYDTYDHMDVDLLVDCRSRYEPAESTELAELLERIIAVNDEKTIARASTLLINDILPHANLYKIWIVWLKNVAAAIKVRKTLDLQGRRTLMARYASLAAKGCLPSLYNGELAKLMSYVRAGEDIKSIKPKWIKLVNPQEGISLEDMARTTSRLMSDLGYNTTCFYRSFIRLGQIPPSAYLWADSSKPSSIPKPLFRPLNAPKSSLPDALQDSLNRAAIQKTCFRKFCLKVLPQISSLSIHIPAESEHAANFHFLTTGLDDPSKSTKPIFSFQERGKHTASWYQATHVTSPEEVDLGDGWVKVKCIVSFPHMWDHFQVHEKSVDEFFDPRAEREFLHREMDMRFLLVLEGINDHHAQGSDLANEFVNEELKCFGREQIEVYRDYHSMRGSYVGGHVGGVVVENRKFRNLMLGVRMKSGEFVRFEVVKFKYFMG